MIVLPVLVAVLHVSGGLSATSGSLTVTPSLPPSVTFTLLSTNPTAVPLSSIVANASSLPTSSLSSTVPPGTQPTFLPLAPPLPNAALLSPSNYPSLDKQPPTNTSLVQQWIQDVNNSGTSIPNIPPTLPGGCAANPAAVADTSRCWWSCSGCTRPSDVTSCPTQRTWGLTYDDGPAYHTPELLSYLDQHGLKSTFFVVGSRVISFPGLLQAEYMGGHQIAVHTWSHPPLTTLSNEEIIAELGWSKKVIKDVLGVTPNTMRPPYGDIDDRVRAISLAMGLTPVIWTRLNPTTTFDTNDFNIASNGTTVGDVLYNWENIVRNASTLQTGFIVLEHDLFQQSVEVATGYILPDGQARNFNIKPVISCLNKPLSDAYIETNNNQTNPPAQSGSAVTRSSGAQATSTSTSSSGAVSIFDYGFSLAVPATLVGLFAGLVAVRT